MTANFTPPTFINFPQGDRGYVSELNKNFKAVVDGFTALENITTGTGLLGLGKVPGIVLGPDNCLIGRASYQITGTTNSVTVSTGYAWLAGPQTVVQNPAPAPIQLKQAGTWYMTINLAGSPVFILMDTPPDNAFYSVVVTTEGEENFSISPPVKLVPTFVSSSNPQGVPAPRPHLAVSTPIIYQIGANIITSLCSTDPRYAGFRMYLSSTKGVVWETTVPQFTGLYPPGIVLPDNSFGSIDYGAMNWVDWYILLGLPQSEIDKIPVSFKYKTVDQSYVWGNGIIGRVKTDYPAHADPDTVNDLVLDMSDSGEVLFDPTLPTSIPHDLQVTPLATETGGLCFLEGGDNGYEIIEYSDFSVTGINEITIPASSGTRRGATLYSEGLSGDVEYWPANTPVDHPAGSRFLYIPYWVNYVFTSANRLYAPRYWISNFISFWATAFFSVSDGAILIKLVPVDIDGNEQDFTTVPAYSLVPVSPADFLPDGIYIPFFINISAFSGYGAPHPYGIPSRNLLVFNYVVGWVYYINRMITIPVPDPGVPVTYWVYFVDPNYWGDLIDYGFLAGNVNTSGSGYAVGDEGTIIQTSGYGDPATYQVTQVDSSGGVIAFEILTSGTHFDVTGKPLQFTGLGGYGLPYNTVASDGSGTGLVVNCTEAGWFNDGTAPRIECLCTTDDSFVGQRGYICIGKVDANHEGTGVDYQASSTDTSGKNTFPYQPPIPSDFNSPHGGSMCQFAPDKIFVGNTGQNPLYPGANSAVVYPYWTEV